MGDNEQDLQNQDAQGDEQAQVETIAQKDAEPSAERRVIAESRLDKLEDDVRKLKDKLKLHGIHAEE